jgi:hypothetical protein
MTGRGNPEMSSPQLFSSLLEYSNSPLRVSLAWKSENELTLERRLLVLGAMILRGDVYLIGVCDSILRFISICDIYDCVLSQ